MAKSLFVTCARGLEPILANELSSLGYKKKTEEYRGALLYFSNTDETMNAVYRYVIIIHVSDFSEFFEINYRVFQVELPVTSCHACFASIKEVSRHS